MSKKNFGRSGYRTKERLDQKVHFHVDFTSSTGPTFEPTPARITAALEKFPELAERLTITHSRDGDTLEPALATADALFAWRFDRTDLARRAPFLRWIHAHGAGVNHLMPLESWLPPKVALTNSRGVHGQRAEEYAWMAILMLNNRIPELVTYQRAGHWQECFNTSLIDKTLLVIGVGHIGSGVAKWAKRFGMRVIGVRRSGRPRRFVDEMHRPDALRSLLPWADFVIVTAPSTKETRFMLGREEIDLLPTGSGLVNYSRAELVDYQALQQRLETGEISAILDVFDPEPLPKNSPLWQTPNLIITPHCSSDDEDRYTPETLHLIFENMQRFLDGKALKNRVSIKWQY